MVPCICPCCSMAVTQQVIFVCGVSSRRAVHNRHFHSCSHMPSDYCDNPIAGTARDPPDTGIKRMPSPAQTQPSAAAAHQIDSSKQPAKASKAAGAEKAASRGARPDVPPSLTEARSRAVYATMERHVGMCMVACFMCAPAHVHRGQHCRDRLLPRLLEASADPEQELPAALQHISGEEYLQVAEERALAGMCGRAACANLLSAPKPKGTFKIDTQQQRIYRDGDIMFCRYAACTPACMLAAHLLCIWALCRSKWCACPPTQHRLRPARTAPGSSSGHRGRGPGALCCCAAAAARDAAVITDEAAAGVRGWRGGQPRHAGRCEGDPAQRAAGQGGRAGSHRAAQCRSAVGGPQPRRCGGLCPALRQEGCISSSRRQHGIGDCQCGRPC